MPFNGDVMLVDNDKPLTYHNTMNNPYSKRGMGVMKTEMNSDSIIEKTIAPYLKRD